MHRLMVMATVMLLGVALACAGEPEHGLGELRGTLEGGHFALYYFDQGQMVGVLAADRPDEERKPMQALVKARPAYEDVLAKLRDEGVSLDTLVE